MTGRKSSPNAGTARGSVAQTLDEAIEFARTRIFACNVAERDHARNIAAYREQIAQIEAQIAHLDSFVKEAPAVRARAQAQLAQYEKIQREKDGEGLGSLRGREETPTIKALREARKLEAKLATVLAGLDNLGVDMNSPEVQRYLEEKR